MSDTYSEADDIEAHRRDVIGLRQVAEGRGYRTSGYRLGLDIGGGLGLHTPWLLESADRVYVSDIIDYNSLYDGELISGIIKKFQRNNVPYDSARVELHKVDAQNTIYRDGIFDLIFSVNAFEHIPDPRAAFLEMVRVSAPGALVMIQFDPLWHSAYGHHLWHLDLGPWAHLLVSDDEFRHQIRAAGGTEQDIDIFNHQTNRQPFRLYEELFSAPPLELFSSSSYAFWSKGTEDDPYCSHPNYQLCLERGWDSKELLVRGVQFVGIRA